MNQTCWNRQKPKTPLLVGPGGEESKKSEANARKNGGGASVKMPFPQKKEV